MNVKIDINPTPAILKAHGLDKSGTVQKFHTQNVLRRIQRYMPYRSGMTIKVTIAQTDINKPEIVTDTPYARYLYHGKVMIGRAPKVVTNIPLSYTKTKNTLAGPYWDKRLLEAERDAMVADLQRFIKMRGR